MRHIRNYNSYKEYKKVNEEFIGKLIKGALGNLFQAFSAPFKDLVDDIKNSFKEDDPNSIKGIVMTNLNQAIDGAQKSIRNLKPPVPGKDGPNDAKETDVETVMAVFIKSLTDLGNNIGNDFNKAIGDKVKASAATEIAKAIIMGSKDAGWEGIVGFLNDPNYKYSKPKYEQILANAAQKKTGTDAFKLKQNAAVNFFDNFQKDISAQFAKDFTEEEMQKQYDAAVKKGGGSSAKFDFNKLEEFKNNKTRLKYKMKGYDDKKAPEMQPNQIGEYPIEEINKDSETVIFIGKNNLRIEKKFSDILGPVEGQEQKKPDLNQEVTNNLKELSKDPKNIEVVKNVTDAIKKDPNIVTKIEEILPKQAVETGGQ